MNFGESLRLASIIVPLLLSVACSSESSEGANVDPPATESGAKPGAPSGSSEPTTNRSGRCLLAPPTKNTICTMPKNIGFDTGSSYVIDSWVTNPDGCVNVYVSFGPDSLHAENLRRYTLANTSPCELKQDITWVDQESSDQVAVDDSGSFVLTGANQTVQRVVGRELHTCTSTQMPDLGNRLLRDLAVSRDGKVGYALFTRSSLIDPVVAKIVVPSDASPGCELVPFALKGTLGLSGGKSIAIDDKNRMHLVDATFAGGNERVAIFDPDGTFVASYAGGEGGKAIDGIADITPCPGGMCLGAPGLAVSYSADGAFRRESRLQFDSGLIGGKLAGAPQGGLFLVGTRRDTTKPDSPATIGAVLFATP